MTLKDDSLPPPLGAALDARLTELDQAMQSLQPDAALEARVLDEFRKRQKRARRGYFGGFDLGHYGIPAAALALSLGVAAWMVAAPLLLSVGNGSAGRNATAPLPSSSAPFVALQPLERIAVEPQARIISTVFPRAWLADSGIPVNPERAGESVRADMLVGSNGQPLAIRVIE
jgi:hypothetical protein